MHPPSRFPYVASPHEQSARDRRDPVVVQAIENVTARQPMEEWWALSPGVRTHVIYDEVRRLDQAWANEPAEPIKEDAHTRRYQMA
jgi:hypothetical protein